MNKLYLQIMLCTLLGLGSLSAAYAVPFAYITGGSFPDGKVSVIDIANNTVVATIPVGSSAGGVGISADGKRVYVANGGSSTVSVIDTASHTVIATVPVRADPRGIAVRPDGARIYVTHQFIFPSTGGNTVSVIDTATNRVIANVRVALDPQGIAVTHDGTRAYVTNTSSQTVSVIDTATHAVTTVIQPMGLSVGGALGIAISPDDSKAYITDRNSGSTEVSRVSVIDLASNTVTNNQIYVGASPIGVSITADGSRAYVANAGSDSVSVIDTATEEVVTGIAVGDRPIAFGMFIAPNPAAPPPGSLQFKTIGYTVAEDALKAVISVTRSGAIGSAASVKYATRNGTALAGSDYTARRGTLTFAAGETGPRYITVPIINDTAPEAKETVQLTLSTPVGATLGTPSEAVLTIINDDPTPPKSASFNSPIFDLIESGGSALIRVNRTGGPHAAFSIDYATRNGTAIAGADYTATSGTLTFTQGGPNSLFFSVPILDDSRQETGETLSLTLSCGTGQPLHDHLAHHR